MAEKRLGYVLFPNHTEAMRLYEVMKAQQVRCTLAPTPRECSVCCGVSLRLENVADLPRAQEAAQENGIEIERVEELAAPKQHTW